jgi:hypothetical protein
MMMMMMVMVKVVQQLCRLEGAAELSLRCVCGLLGWVQMVGQYDCDEGARDAVVQALCGVQAGQQLTLHEVEHYTCM